MAVVVKPIGAGTIAALHGDLAAYTYGKASLCYRPKACAIWTEAPPIPGRERALIGFAVGGDVEYAWYIRTVTDWGHYEEDI